jgi:hypothetical protein
MTGDVAGIFDNTAAFMYNKDICFEYGLNIWQNAICSDMQLQGE